jgi:hypothetical protein
VGSKNTKPKKHIRARAITIKLPVADPAALELGYICGRGQNFVIKTEQVEAIRQVCAGLFSRRTLDRRSRLPIKSGSDTIRFILDLIIEQIGELDGA